MTRLVVVDTQKLNYKVFEDKKCIAEFTAEKDNIPTPEAVENIRTANYTLA